MSKFCDNAASSDDGMDYESENGNNNVYCEEDDECGKLVRIVSDINIARCNTDDGRKEHSGFDISCRRHLGHFFAWKGTHTKKRKMHSWIP